MPNNASKDTGKIGRTELAPAKGKLGIMIPGMGAGATTFVAGVVAVRKGIASPIGSVTQMGTVRLGKRADNQQDRLDQGVKSGQPTAGETANLEKNEANVNKEVSADRKANGGKLTQSGKAQVNKQQNHLSNQIYKDKHNSFRQMP
ncbi:MAG TPA: inositol-3-phosphate synthase [Dongiaceae bacterium]|nr:inositol-3-phosphate synthase [Dongiaceae bacterium]